MHDVDDPLDDEEIEPSSGSDLSSRVSGVMSRISGILSKSNDDDGDEDEIDEVFLRKRHASDHVNLSDSMRSPRRMSETTRKALEARKSHQI